VKNGETSAAPRAAASLRPAFKASAALFLRTFDREINAPLQRVGVNALSVQAVPGEWRGTVPNEPVCD
jgi:hypothetical protein